MSHPYSIFNCSDRFTKLQSCPVFMLSPHHFFFYLFLSFFFLLQSPSEVLPWSCQRLLRYLLDRTICVCAFSLRQEYCHFLVTNFHVGFVVFDIQKPSIANYISRTWTLISGSDLQFAEMGDFVVLYAIQWSIGYVPKST